MRYQQTSILLFLCLLVFSQCQDKKTKQARFAILADTVAKRVDITVNGKPFTSYIYPDTIMKPVLYPLSTTSGTLITRGWPIAPRPGERVDHPHHIGLWFNYGDANGLDFWNNSTAIPAEKKQAYGTIRHAKINHIATTDDYADLDVTSYWQKPDGTSILQQDTRYRFTEKDSQRAIEITAKLTALKEDVLFTDNKEGLVGMRVARELEQPSKEPSAYVDAGGNITRVEQLDDSLVSGHYRSSEGLAGDSVWGTRAKWVNLNGQINKELISLVILDNPHNIGYPSYWHARGYGLFAANPLGQNAMSGGKETLNYKLPAGQSTTFRYKILIQSGKHLNDKEVSKQAALFAQDSLQTSAN